MVVASSCTRFSTILPLSCWLIISAARKFSGIHIFESYQTKWVDESLPDILICMKRHEFLEVCRALVSFIIACIIKNMLIPKKGA